MKPVAIQSFYTDCLTAGRKDGTGGLSAQTVLHFHRVFHKALGQAMKWQLLARNPADAVEPPRPVKREMRALDEAGTARLLQVLDGNRLFLPVLLAVTTGLRRGEILALRWQDIDLEIGEAFVCRSLEQSKSGLRFKSPKTSKSRRKIALPSFALEYLRSHKLDQAKTKLRLGPAYEDHGLVCPAADGRPWAPDVLSTAFAAFIRNSSLSPIRFHDLRHSHATHLLKAGIHPKIVSERLGHATIAITLDTYSHVLPGLQEEAASRLDIALRSAIARHNDPN